MLLRAIGLLTLSALFGCSTAEDVTCVNVAELSDSKLGELIGKELNKIFYDPDHFHRRTGEPEDYEIIELDGLKNLDSQAENIEDNESE